MTQRTRVQRACDALARATARWLIEGDFAHAAAHIRPELCRLVRALRRSERDLPAHHVDDLVQDILLAAHRAIHGGRLIVFEDSARHVAFSRWLHGIAWRQLNHHRDKAYHRREVPRGLRLCPRETVETWQMIHALCRTSLDDLRLLAGACDAAVEPAVTQPPPWQRRRDFRAVAGAFRRRLA